MIVGTSRSSYGVESRELLISSELDPINRSSWWTFDASKGSASILRPARHWNSNLASSVFVSLQRSFFQSYEILMTTNLPVSVSKVLTERSINSWKFARTLQPLTKGRKGVSEIREREEVARNPKKRGHSGEKREGRGVSSRERAQRDP